MSSNEPIVFKDLALSDSYATMTCDKTANHGDKLDALESTISSLAKTVQAMSENHDALTAYLNAFCSYTAGSATAYGRISAVRAG